jgi:hypothetical protein
MADKPQPSARKNNNPRADDAEHAGDIAPDPMASAGSTGGGQQTIPKDRPPLGKRSATWDDEEEQRKVSSQPVRGTDVSGGVD